MKSFAFFKAMKTLAFAHPTSQGGPQKVGEPRLTLRSSITSQINKGGSSPKELVDI
jgi:hypothetical protein